MKNGRDIFVFFFAQRSLPITLINFCLLFTVPTVFLSCEHLNYNRAGMNAPGSIVWRRPAVYGAFETGFVKRETEISTNSLSTLDILVYDDDDLGRLDIWQRYGTEELADGRVTLLSGRGSKNCVFIANYDELPTLTMDKVGCYDAIKELEIHLSDEKPDRPIMVGSVCVADADTDIQVILEPLLANIHIGEVSCDFSGKPYQGARMENVKIYLTNVSASVPLLGSSTFIPTDMINYGRLVETDLGSLSCPEMLFYSYSTAIGNGDSVEEPVDLYCYPNNVETESIGCQYTRVVLQADIEGNTYYYPISLNQKGFGYSVGSYGISPNSCYTVNLKITKKGSTSPNDMEDADDVSVKGWMELHPGQFIRAHVGDSVHVWCDLFPEQTPLDICREDLDFDVERGVYTYDMDSDGKGVTLYLKHRGTGLFTIDAGYPVNSGYLVMVVAD